MSPGGALAVLAALLCLWPLLWVAVYHLLFVRGMVSIQIGGGGGRRAPSGRGPQWDADADAAPAYTSHGPPAQAAPVNRAQRAQRRHRDAAG